MSRRAAGVIFDLDGVLIDSEALQHRAYNQVLARFGIQVDAQLYGREWIAAGRGPEYAVRTYGLPVTPAELRRLKDPVYHALLQQDVQLVRGAREAVARLGAAFPLVVATNSNAQDTAFVLERFGLRAAFTAVVTREGYENAKPAPDAFAAAAAALGLPPERCAVIEDAYKGVAAAAAAGCACIAFPHDYTAENDVSRARAVIRSLDELSVELVRAVLGDA
ncbi:MAG: HAD family hydrolase [Candidatus Binatia bacterium]